jgi:nitrite reductase (NADH) small subunit/3-phenylpropionate/trans-cinnamate dioxygenase ferredoxin subunit
MAEFRKVATLAEVADGTMKLVQAGGAAIALCRLGGAVYATANTCPHRGGSLGEGSVQDGAIVCPWHGFRYDPKTGRCLNNPALAVACHPVRVEGQDILVEV